ncbi:MAG: Bug family tripartite tricarboxylate transporter substrate binding protein [Burkholderiales bacterium]
MLAVAAPAQAQSYPVKPIRLVVAGVAGTSMDTMARTLGPALTEKLGQAIVVDNRGGASGALAADAARYSAPNGYTLLLASSTLAIRPLLYKVPYDLARDFAPVTQLSLQPYLLMASNSVSAQSVPELIAVARANPGKLSYGSVGNGSQIHLMSELFRLMSKIEVVHVPYKGIPVAYPDLASGNIQFMFGSVVTGISHVKAQRIRGLAVSGSQRVQLLPELPTITESGVPGFVVTQWNGLLAPAGTPRGIVEFLNKEINSILRQPDMAARISTLGTEAAGSTPEQLAALLKADRARWRRVIKDAGIRGEE